MIRGRLIAHLKQTTELTDEFEDKIDALERNSLLLDDIGQMAVQARDLQIESEAALNFAQSGPRRLEELTVAESGEGFSSYNAFLKCEEEDPLEKRFGPAGDGYQYHHIVEAGINRVRFRRASCRARTTSSAFRLCSTKRFPPLMADPRRPRRI